MAKFKPGQLFTRFGSVYQVRKLPRNNKFGICTMCHHKNKTDRCMSLSDNYDWCEKEIPDDCYPHFIKFIKSFNIPFYNA